MPINEEKLNELLGSFVTDLGGSFQAISAVIGDRIGLYRALLAVMPATPAEVAAQAGVGERYVSEWLKGQMAGGYVTYDPTTERFSLTEEQAFALASPDGMQIAAAFHLPVAVAKNVEPITEAVRTNDGFGWHQHDAELFEGTERFFRPGYVANLVSSWIPALEGVGEKLQAGATVADVGCGHGASTVLLGEAYPRSKVTGFDYHRPSIEQARKRAADAGLTSRGCRSRWRQPPTSPAAATTSSPSSTHCTTCPTRSAPHDTSASRSSRTGPSCSSSPTPTTRLKPMPTRWVGSITRAPPSSVSPTR
jgi:hypothetical protein